MSPAPAGQDSDESKKSSRGSQSSGAKSPSAGAEPPSAGAEPPSSGAEPPSAGAEGAEAAGEPSGLDGASCWKATKSLLTFVLLLPKSSLATESPSTWRRQEE